MISGEGYLIIAPNRCHFRGQYNPSTHGWVLDELEGLEDFWKKRGSFWVRMRMRRARRTREMIEGDYPLQS